MRCCLFRQNVAVETKVGLHVKYASLLSDLKQNWNLSTNFSLTPQCQFRLCPFGLMSNLTKICLATFDLSHADRQTDMVKINVAFLQLLVEKAST
jgi:hypothetical protein